MMVAAEPAEIVTGTAVDHVADLEAKLARRSNDRKRFIEAFGDDDDRMLIDAIHQLGVEVKQIEAELAEARKVAKTIEHADRRDFYERLTEAVGRMTSKVLTERQAARATVAQAFRSLIDVIALHRDHRLTVRIKENGFIHEKEYSPEGWVRSHVISPDGTVLRAAMALWESELELEWDALADRAGKVMDGSGSCSHGLDQVDRVVG